MKKKTWYASFKKRNGADWIRVTKWYTDRQKLSIIEKRAVESRTRVSVISEIRPDHITLVEVKTTLPRFLASFPFRRPRYAP